MFAVKLNKYAYFLFAQWGNDVLRKIMTLTGYVFTMRRISASANTALLCTKCIDPHVVHKLYSYERGVLLTERRRFTTLWSCVLSTVHFFAPLKDLDSRVRKYKRCSLSCGMGKYSTCPRKKVFGRVLYFTIPHSNDHRLHIIHHPSFW